MWETVAGKLVAAGLTRGGDTARRKLRDRLRSGKYDEEVDHLATVFNRELETAIREEAEKRDSDVLEAITLNWEEIAKELSDPDVVLESETEAVRRVAEAIAAPEGHDLEADPDLGRGLRSAVKEAYRTAIASFRESIAGTDLGHELELEASIDISRQLRDLERRLEGREYYDVFPGDEEGLDTAAGLVANRRLEYVEREELEDQPESDRMLVVGRKGVGKSRALAEMLTGLEPRRVEHVIHPRDPLTKPQQLEPLIREHFEGDVMLVWDDVHKESNHVFTDAVRRLDDILSENGDDLLVFASARTEADDEIPGDYGDPEGFWESHGFTELQLGLLEDEPLRELFEGALSTYDVSANDRAKSAFLQRAKQTDPSPFFVETVVRTGGTRLTIQDVEELPDTPLDIWKSQYMDLHPLHEEAQFVLRSIKLLSEMDVPLYRSLVRALYKNVFGPGRQNFHRAVNVLERKGWIDGFENKTEDEPTKFILHDLQLAAITQPFEQKVQSISQFLLKSETENIVNLAEEVDYIANVLFASTIQRIGEKYFHLAEKHYKYILENHDQDDVPTHYNFGVLREEQGRCEEAESHFQSALEADPENVQVRVQLGVLYWNQDSIKEAAEHYKAALDVDPSNSHAHLHLGDLRKEQGELKEATEHYRTAIDINSENVDAHPEFEADAHFRFARLKEEQDHPEEAIAHFKAAIENDQNHANAHAHLGVLLSENETTEKGVDYFRKAIEINPNHAMAHFNLGVCLEKQDCLDEAIEHYKSAVESDPDFPMPHYNLGVIYHNNDEYSDAISKYKAAIDADPDFAMAHTNLGSIRLEQGELAKGANHLNKALEADPHLAEAHSNLGMLLTGRDNSTAKKHIEDSIKKSAAREHFHRGLIYSINNESIEITLTFLEILLSVCLEHGELTLAREYHNRVRTAMENADEPIDDDLWQQLDELADRLSEED